MAQAEDRGSERARSLGEVRESVNVPLQPAFWRRLFAFMGPAYLVSVGYMDPGNWATDIAAGSALGYSLIWVLFMSNLMAILLQVLSARLGIVTGMDLAQACRAMFSRRVSWALWILTEIAIVACDLAEVLGSAIGLQLLFHLPLLVGVLLTVLDTFILLYLQRRGVRMMEAFIVALITTIGACLAIEVFLSKPAWGAIAVGFLPSLPGDRSLFLAIGIIGATVMPHNLYLHSSLVQSRRIRHTPAGIRSGVRFNIIDSVFALNVAFFINAALLVLAAATFHKTGHQNIVDILGAHHLLEPILGAWIAPVAFAIALLASGQSSTITGTLAGQIVMEGFVNLRLTPAVRRLLTRGVAIIPALATIIFFGESATGMLLLISQVVLSLQLSFAVIPLIHLVSDRRWMGQYRVKPALQMIAWLVAGVIVALNMRLAFDEIFSWLRSASGYGWILGIIVIPASLALVGLLAYVTILPAIQRWRGDPTPALAGVHGPSSMPPVEPPPPPKRIGAAIDFSSADTAVLSHAVTLARAAGRGSVVVLLHVVESGGARLMGSEMQDSEARSDQQRLELYTAELGELGVDAFYDLGFGEPPEQLAALIHQHKPDIIIAGSHGHKGINDLVYGTTVEKLRHRIGVPLLVVPASGKHRVE